MSENKNQSLTAHLQQIKQQYQQKNLISRLEKLAASLRELLLEEAVVETVLNYDTQTHDALRGQIRQLKAAADAGDLTTVARHIEEAEESLDVAESQMQGNRVDPQSAFINRLDSMERLNQQLNVVDQTTLSELRKLAEDGRWTANLDIDEDTPIEDAIDIARAFGNERRKEYETAEQKIFKPYFEGELKDIVKDLLSDSPPVLGETDPDTIDKLAESKLGEHVGLRFR